jgi:hypothetical protein
MKAREQRRRVTTRARMRTDSGWSDVTISDVSSRGMGLRSPRAPRRGDYIELCRHHHKLVARVMWSDGESFGILLSDPIVVEELLSSRPGRRPEADRRSQPRHAGAQRAAHSQVAIISLAQNSQHASRMMNFVAVVAIACIGAGFAASLAEEVLSQAMSAVTAGLVQGRAEAAVG